MDLLFINDSITISIDQVDWMWIFFFSIFLMLPLFAILHLILVVWVFASIKWYQALQSLVVVVAMMKNRNKLRREHIGWKRASTSFKSCSLNSKNVGIWHVGLLTLVTKNLQQMGKLDDNIYFFELFLRDVVVYEFQKVDLFLNDLWIEI